MSNKTKRANLPRSVNVPATIIEVKNEPATIAPEKVKKPRPAYLVFLQELIAEGKMTQSQLKVTGQTKFPEVAKSTIETVLVDSKNPKYNRFSKLVVKGEAGILAFAN